MLRLWSLVILACVGAFAPSRASARVAETRTWNFFAATANARPESAPQVADSRRGFEGHGYELAPGYSQAAERTTTLYRAVGPAELADINATGVLRNLGSAEGKYFTTSAADASAYAKQAVRGFGDPPYTLIKTEVPNSAFQGLSPATVDRGIPAWVIPNNRLPGLTPVVQPSMPIPPPKF